MAKKISQLPLLDALSGDEDFLVAFNGSNYRVKSQSFAYLFTKESFGLGKVDNTSDEDKPLSKATREALSSTATKQELQDLSNIVGQKANSSHFHQLGDIQGLSQALATKSDVVHRHGIADVEGLENRFQTVDQLYRNLTDTVIPSLNQSYQSLLTRVNGIVIPTSWTIAGVSGLTEALNNKANALHEHTVSQIRDFQQSVNSLIDTKLTVSVSVSDW